MERDVLDRLSTRRRALGILGAALLLPACASKGSDKVRIGALSTSEGELIAEIYAAALERENIPVERHTNLGDAQSAMGALQRGDIDLYPGHELSDATKHFYEQRYGITWLLPAPVNDSECLVTSQIAAQRYWLLNLTKCAHLASELRLSTTPDWVAPGGTLERLRKIYGGFHFKEVLTFDAGTQYYAVARGDADVANAFATDPKIAEDQLIVLADDKHFWPQRRVVPVIRLATLHADERIKRVLNHTSQTLTQFALQQMNMRRDLLHIEARDLAEDFIAQRRSFLTR